MSNFNSEPLTCNPTLRRAKNSPDRAKSNYVFPGKGRGDRALILTYINSPMAEVFPYSIYFCSIRLSSGENGGVKVGQKCKFWVRPFSIKTRILQKFFSTFFGTKNFENCQLDKHKHYIDETYH